MRIASFTGIAALICNEYRKGNIPILIKDLESNGRYRENTNEGRSVECQRFF